MSANNMWIIVKKKRNLFLGFDNGCIDNDYNNKNDKYLVKGKTFKEVEEELFKIFNFNAEYGIQYINELK